ncbi:hypothetical protein [Patulibacter medicamentivorans]|uniref:hypothetical protein n=1 Tax=Patulibacter medicamentivorans TaxID=1097667 RepID=UPI000681A4C1|nr:hypothetical protein [Patulibacter medicamentivorans]
MRPPVDVERIRALAVVLSRATRTETVLYLTGGATAVIEGWRASTVDIDLRLEPDSDEVMKALVQAKRDLDINVESASAGLRAGASSWRDRSPASSVGLPRRQCG